MFEIKISVENHPFSEGYILINDFEEVFYSNCEFWTVKDYYLNWLKACEDLQTKGKGIFITSFDNPNNGGGLVSWPAYKTDKKIIIIEQWLIYEELNEKFDYNNLLKYYDNIDIILEEINEKSVDDFESISFWDFDEDDLYRYKEDLIIIVNKFNNND